MDEDDLHLLLSPLIEERYDFRSGQFAVIDKDKCIECGLYQELCRFDAIHDYKIDPVRDKMSQMWGAESAPGKAVLSYLKGVLATGANTW